MYSALVGLDGYTWTSAVTLMEGSTLANSSIAMIAVVNDASDPPYSAGVSIPINYHLAGSQI